MSTKIYLTFLLSAVLLSSIDNVYARRRKSDVPKIDHKNFAVTQLEEGGYSLQLIMPNGRVSVEEVEIINKDTPEQYLAVKKTGVKIYAGAINKSTYTPDEMDYIDKYNQVISTLKKGPELGALVLKSTAG